MTALNIVLAILLFVAAIFLIVAVLIQSGKDKGVSGAITGGASETYYGRNKGKSRDKKLSLITTIVAIVFVLLAIVAYVTQPYTDEGDYWERVFGIGAYSSTATSTNASSTAGSTDASTDNSTTDASTDESTTDVSSDVEAGTTDSEPTADSSTTDSEPSNDTEPSDTENSETGDNE